MSFSNIRKIFTLALMFLANAETFAQPNMTKNNRPRARETGLKIGILPTGSLNSITDVAGVRVGHSTVFRNEKVRTGVTAILQHGGNLFQEKSRARFLSATALAN